MRREKQVHSIGKKRLPSGRSRRRGKKKPVRKDNHLLCDGSHRPLTVKLKDSKTVLKISGTCKDQK